MKKETCCAYMLTIEPCRLAYAASAMAVNSMIRYIIASVFPPFIIQMYDGLGVDGQAACWGS